MIMVFLFSCDLLYQSFTLWLLASPLSIKIYGKQASTLAAMLISLVHLILRSYISFISDVFTQQFLTFNCSLLALSFHILSSTIFAFQDLPPHPAGFHTPDPASRRISYPSWLPGQHKARPHSRIHACLMSIVVSPDHPGFLEVNVEPLRRLL